ncbi:MAG: ATP-binding protein [Ignavibacteria bacterium]|nr:ATP-binding protein [Ignavibacteria bacterium]HEX2961963.1 ATP-binding protein [Ignavibacteriales bacterium]MCU7500699.1 ATP-binding protein [Ignavibacteria bacterium]MCU7511308.1 ATP-binding protein [Ignavibacteria bacterium]MCU7518970.1 ATP-binding protein [Ignavibacteria bacterium]
MKTANKLFEKELVVKSTTDNLALIRDFTKSAAQKCGFTEETIDKIALAVDEACTNVIKHAYKYSPEGDIIVNININHNKMTVSITDHGTNFDPSLVPEPDVKKYYRQHKIGGLGIYLMRKLMDEVNFSSVAGSKNQVVLVKYF